MRCAYCGTAIRSKKTHRLHTRNCERRGWCADCGWHKSAHKGGKRSIKVGNFIIGPVCRNFKEPARKFRVHGKATG